MGDMSLAEVIFQILKDGKPHSNYELVGNVWQKNRGYQGPSIARLGARIYDIKQTYGVTINGEFDPDDRRKYWYTMKLPKSQLRKSLLWARRKKRHAKEMLRTR